MAALSVSAFAADAGHAARDIRRIQDSGADSIHADVMDGQFVTLTGLGDNWFDAMHGRISLPVEVHFMTLSPGRLIRRFVQYRMATAIFHVEAMAADDVAGLLALLKRHGIRGGLALSPDAEPAALHPYLPLLDEILVMTSRPGEPHSVFIPNSETRIQSVRRLVDAVNPRVTVAVDGGLDAGIALDCIAAGAHKVVLGRSFFRHHCPEELVESIHGVFA